MSLEGELVLRLEWAPGRIGAVSAESRRPRIAKTLLPGRTPGEAVNLVASLFAICGRAQGAAAAAAVEAARGEEPAPGMSPARHARIVAETILEHAWRVLLDWPRAAHREPDVRAMAAIRETLAPSLDAGEPLEGTALADLLEAHVLGCVPGEWLALHSLEALRDWCARTPTGTAHVVGALLAEATAQGASDVTLLEPIDGETIYEIMDRALEAEGDYEAAPHWNGAARETGVLARMQALPVVADAIARRGRGVDARRVARLAELAWLADSLDDLRDARHGAVRTARGDGFAWVATARGLLAHRVRLEGGRVADWRIVAPTEWNFHPQGAFCRGARALTPGSAAALEADASRLAASLDPCVPWRVEVGHA